MNAELQKNCNLLLENKSILKDSFTTSFGIMKIACAAIFASEGKLADAEKIKECNAIIKKHFGIFSDVRGSIRPIVLSKMSLSEDPERFALDLKAALEILKKKKHFHTENRVLTALTIYEHTNDRNFEENIDRAIDLFSRFKNEHRFLTSEEDLPFAAILALSDSNIDSLVEDIEACFNELKPHFSDSNSVQSLSHVLATLPADVKKKCDKVLEINAGLKAAKHGFGNGIEIAILGALAGLTLSSQEIVKEVIETDDFLAGQNGFAGLSMDSGARRLFSSLMVVTAHADEIRKELGVAVSDSIATTITFELCFIIFVSTMAVLSAVH